MSKTIGILLFDDAEELDFVGPFEVFTMAKMTHEMSGNKGYEVLLISETGGQVRAAKGMRLLSDCSIAEAPKLDVLLVPGGEGTRREVDNKPVLEWIAETSKSCEWVTSVCTGSFVLAAAGPAKGKKVTTHWAYKDELRERGEAGEVVGDYRFVRDGNIVTSAGVSAGIDMALWIVGQMESPQFARNVQKFMEYDPAPPYSELV